MSDIELVIKIPERIHYGIEKGITVNGSKANQILIDAVKNGTLLPKGHGKLIVEPTEEDIAKTIGGQNDFAECIRDSVKAVFDNADAILEADKAESEDT